MIPFKTFISLSLVLFVCAAHAQFSLNSEEKFQRIADNVLEYLNLQVTKNVAVPRSSFQEVGNKIKTYDNKAEEYIENQDVSFKLPIIGTVAVSGRNLDNEELDINLKFTDKNIQEGKSRKTKLKKVFAPILVLIILKFMTLVPLALGMLDVQAWTGLFAGLFAFIISAGLAIFELCRKVAVENKQPQIAAHGPWEAAVHNHIARSFDKPDTDAQRIVYSAYLQ